MRCPYCGRQDSKVLETRPADDGFSIRRRRECLECTKRFTTYEKLDDLPLIVIKKDGRREVFDHHKIINGMIKACEKRSVPLSKIEELARDVEHELISSSLNREINSEKIGETIMEKLRLVDEVAYVRFASVYREFKDISTFLQEIETLLRRK